MLQEGFAGGGLDCLQDARVVAGICPAQLQTDKRKDVDIKALIRQSTNNSTSSKRHPSVAQHLHSFAHTLRSQRGIDKTYRAPHLGTDYNCLEILESFLCS
jgi:hypothetical protein